MDVLSAVLEGVVTGFPYLIKYFSVTIGILIAGTLVYTAITPHKELELIKEGNTAAAISFSGGILGLAIPLAFCLSSSLYVADIIVWGVVILAVQLSTYFVINIILRRLTGGISKSVEEGNVAVAIFTVSIKLSVAAINAAIIA